MPATDLERHSFALNVIGQFLKFVNEVIDLTYDAYWFAETKFPRSLDTESLVEELDKIKDLLALSFRHQVGCLSKQEQDIVNLRQACLWVAEDLKLRFEWTDNAVRQTENRESLLNDVILIWSEESLSALKDRLSDLVADLEQCCFTFQREFGGATADDILGISDDVTSPNHTNKINVQKQHRIPEDGTVHGSMGQDAVSAQNNHVDADKIARAIELANESVDKAGVLYDFIIDGLKFKSMGEREEEVASAHAKTFDWIFKQEHGSNFMKWLRNDDQGGLYWINGKAGSGKSTLMRFLFEHKIIQQQLILWADKKFLSIAGFFFWTSGSLDQRSQNGLLRSLLVQLLEQHRHLIPATFPELWMTCWAKTTQERILMTLSWSTAELVSALKRFLCHASDRTKICLFIDGLDEFDGDPEVIIDFISSILKSQEADVKVCVSSRPWEIFDSAFQAVPNLKLQSLTSNDMVHYVEDNLAKHTLLRKLTWENPEVFTDLVMTAVQKADGVFLWVMLVIQHLLQDIKASDDHNSVLASLQKFPNDLDDLFSHLLFDKFSLSELHEISKIFQLIRAREIVSEIIGDESAASLTTWELALALEKTSAEVVNDTLQVASSQEVIELCGRLKLKATKGCAWLLKCHEKDPTRDRFNLEEILTNRLVNGKITYLHRTVRDFILQKTVGNRDLQLTVGEGFDPHISLLKSFVHQLKWPIGKLEQHRKHTERWWSEIVLSLTHAQVSSMRAVNEQIALVNELNSVLEQLWKKRWTNDDQDHWAKNTFGSYETRKNFVTSDPFLLLATKFGLTNYVEHQVRIGKTSYHEGPTLLGYAIMYLIDRHRSVYPLSSPDMVSALLSHGANPNQAYRDMLVKCETPWLSALKSIREATRREFIEYYDVYEDGTPRWVRIMQLLLQNGADPNAVIVKDGWDPETTALEVVEAALEKYGSNQIKKLRDDLIEKGARPKKETRPLVLR